MVKRERVRERMIKIRVGRERRGGEERKAAKKILLSCQIEGGNSEIDCTRW